MMVKVAILNLKDSENMNRWIIGGPPQIQIAYVKNVQ